MKLNDFDYLSELPGEEREQNWIRMRLGTLSVREGVVLTAAAQAAPPKDAVQAINQLQALDEYTVCQDVGSYEELGERYLRLETLMPDDAFPFINLRRIGEIYEAQHPGLFIDRCYVQYPAAPPEPVYQSGMALPTDDGWSVKLKIASPAVPDGVWLRLPQLDLYCDWSSIEKVMAVWVLCVQSWDECTLLDAESILPEAGDLLAQYSGSVGNLIHDGAVLGHILARKDQGPPCFMERYAAAMQLENCQSLKQALDIAQNLKCYDWEQSADLKASGMALLLGWGVPEELIRDGGIDPAHYKAHLLEQDGYTPTADGLGYIRRNANKFHYEFSTPAQPQEEPGMAMQ